MTGLESDLENQIAQYYCKNPALLNWLREVITNGRMAESRKRDGCKGVTVSVKVFGRQDMIQVGLKEAGEIYRLALNLAVQKKMGRGIIKQ